MHSASFVRIAFSLALICAVSTVFILEFNRVYEVDRAYEAVVTKKLHMEMESSGGHADDEQLPVLHSISDPDRIIRAFRNAEIYSIADNFFNGKVCQSMMLQPDTTYEQHVQHSTLVDISYSCHDAFQHMWFGTGNLILTFYALRAAAHVLGKTDVIIQCNDAESSKDSLILPWLMGIFPSSPHDSSKAIEHPTPQDGCVYKHPRPMGGAVVLGWIWNEMQFELRRMAIAMVGIPSTDHPSAAWAEENLWSHPAVNHRHGHNYMQLPHPKKSEAPIYPGTHIDDAILHFRCGDLVNMADGNMMGFMSFKSFARHVSPDARSIGIVTQPFEEAAQVRQRETIGVITDRCRVLVGAFVDYLQEHFPNAQVSVHNNRNETITLTFARMIMANQTVVGISSFGEFAALATFGTGYIRHVQWDVHDFMVEPPMLERLEENNVILIPGPLLIAPEFKRQWEENSTNVLEWFKN